MSDNGIVVQRKNPEDLGIENLPDGSTAVFDAVTQTIHSLDPVAAAAFRACSEPKTVAELQEAMSQALDTAVSEALALRAIAELESARLVVVSESGQSSPIGASRRSVLTSALKAAGAAVPLVLSLTASEQSVFAQGAGSGTTTSTTSTTTTSTTTSTTTTTTSTTTTTTTTTTAAPGPTLSILPNSYGGCNSSQSGYVITGVNTHFVQGTSQISFNSSHYSASNVVVSSPTSLSLTINQSGSAATSFSVTVTVTTGSEVAVGTNILSVSACF